MKRVCIVIIMAGALIALEWQSIGKIPVGRADDIAIGYRFPENEQRIYVADQYSWPYKSIDGGMSWNSLLHEYTNNPISIVCDQNDAKNVWIARSLPNENPGVFYSSDEGATWTPRNNGITNFKILTFSMAPDNSNHLFLGCTYDPNVSSNIFKTENGGMIWYALTPVQSDVYDIETPSSNSGIIIVATSNGIYKTIDGGANWYQTYNYKVMDLKINPLNSNEIYACVSNPPINKIIKSNDGGENWHTVLNLPLNHNPVSIDISKEGEIYAGVNNQNEGIIYKSIKGKNWQKFIFKSKINILKIDQRNLSVFILSNGKIYKLENKKIAKIENE